ncbi:MAG: hypothetical protein AB7I19_08005 [Planctomycetota bacterium]
MNLRNLSLAALLGLATSISADEVRLTDGTLLYGSVKDQGDRVVVHTRTGDRTVQRDEIDRIRTEAELLVEFERLRSSSPNSAHANIALAELARSRGLLGPLWECLGEAIAARPQGHTAKRLRDLLATLEPELLGERRPANAKGRVRMLLLAARDPNRPAHRRAAATILAGADGEALEILRRSARHGTVEADRGTALTALAMREDAADQRTLWRASLIDASPNLRALAMDLARAHSVAEPTIRYLAAQLTHDHLEVRLRSAEALGRLGNQAAILPLVLAAPTAASAPAAGSSPGATRGHIAITEQRAYIRDFDPEIASAAFIADPKIGVLQSGVVLDVTVAAVITERVITTFRRTLTKLGGSDPGTDMSRWEAWARQARATSN